MDKEKLVLFLRLLALVPTCMHLNGSILSAVDEKLNQGKYPGIKEFVCDFRLILVNCFRYNGVVSRMGRIADKLELLFEQKLQLLPA